MWLEELAREAWYSHNPGGVAAFLSFALRPVAAIYAAAVQIRNNRYLKSKSLRNRFDIPVICLGNITLGGSGKTPSTIFIAKTLVREGIKSAVISRGYRGTMEGRVATVSDGENILLPAREAGDEPVMIAEKLPGVPVIIGASRSDAVRHVQSHFDVDCVVLDDGLQHLALYRDLDILCINGELGLGNGLVFPAGPLREKLTGVSRAQLCLVNHFGKYSENIEKDLRSAGFTGHLVHVEYKISEYKDLQGNQIEKNTFDNKCCSAFASVAHPEIFFRLLKSEGLNIQQNVAYSDHYQYKIEDIRRFSSLAKEKGIEYYVTTEKDGVKLPDGGRDIEVPVLTAKIAPQTTREDEKLILDILKGAL